MIIGKVFIYEKYRDKRFDIPTDNKRIEGNNLKYSWLHWACWLLRFAIVTLHTQQTQRCQEFNVSNYESSITADCQCRKNACEKLADNK